MFPVVAEQVTLRVRVTGWGGWERESRCSPAVGRWRCETLWTEHPVKYIPLAAPSAGLHALLHTRTAPSRHGPVRWGTWLRPDTLPHSNTSPATPTKVSSIILQWLFTKCSNAPLIGSKSDKHTNAVHTRPHFSIDIHPNQECINKFESLTTINQMMSKI